MVESICKLLRCVDDFLVAYQCVILGIEKLVLRTQEADNLDRVILNV